MALLPRSPEADALDAACVADPHDEGARLRLAAAWKREGFAREAEFVADATIGPRAVGFAEIHNLTVTVVVEVVSGTAARHGVIGAEHFAAIGAIDSLHPDGREALWLQYTRGDVLASLDGERLFEALARLRADLGENMPPVLVAFYLDASRLLTNLAFGVCAMRRAAGALMKLDGADGGLTPAKKGG